MKNLAGCAEADEVIREELYLAGISVVNTRECQSGSFFHAFIIKPPQSPPRGTLGFSYLIASAIVLFRFCAFALS